MTEAQLESSWMQFARFRLDPVTYMVVVANGRMVQLSATEFQVLYDLIFHAGRFRTSEDIFRTVWGGRTAKAKASNVVAVYIRRLRHKIETDPTHPVHIITSRCKGYLFRP
jgi:DNA-binding response OmpR family regulator